MLKKELPLLNIPLKEHFAKSLAPAQEGIPDAIRTQVDLYLQGKEFPIDHTTGKFSDKAMALASFFTTKLEDLFGFGEERYQAVVKKLEGDWRVAFKLYARGMPIEEIADVTGFSVNKAKSFVDSALIKIQNLCYQKPNTRLRVGLLPTATEMENFYLIGAVDHPKKFMPAWQSLSIGRNKIKPDAFARAFQRFHEEHHGIAPESCPKGKLSLIVDLQVLNEAARIRDDMNPSALRQILLTCHNLNVQPSRKMLSQIEKIIHGNQEFMESLKDVPMCEPFIPKKIITPDTGPDTEVVTPPPSPSNE